jgi:integrase
MQWEEIDLKRRIWTIPRERSKSDRAHEVHFSDLAVEIIQGLPQLAGSPFVFTTKGDRYVTGYSKGKAALDKRTGIATAWTLHDLRRTAATGMAKLNIPPHVVDRVLNHTGGTISGVAAIYNRFTYLDERKAALEAWSRYVGSLVRPAPANVVTLAREARA